MKQRELGLITATILACVSLGACDSSAKAYRVVGELASDRHEITADFAEPIIEIIVAEGEPVAKGQIILRQDTARAEAELAQLEAALSQRQARLDELVRGPRSERIAAARASLEGATQELAFRESELERVREVHAKGLASAELLDSTRALLDTARANHKLALAELEERLAGTTVEELAQAEHAVRQAAAQRDRAAIDLDRHMLKAPADGILDSRMFELGERPASGQPVFTVLSGEQPYARVYVPETMRVRVKPGTAALIHVDGMTGPLEGRLRWIANDPAFTPYFALTERDRGRLSFVAKVDLNEQRERLPDGVPVEVEFLFDKDT